MGAFRGRWKYTDAASSVAGAGATKTAFCRREILLTAFVGAGFCFVSEATAGDAQSAELQVEWRVTDDQVKSVSEAMPVTKAETYDQRNPLLIGAIVLIGVSLVPKLAQAIADVYYRYKSGGVIIDTRGQPVIISTSPRVAPGYALVISNDGVKTIQVGGAQPISAEDLKGLMDVLLTAAQK
jgi:hypothetical protein